MKKFILVFITCIILSVLNGFGQKVDTLMLVRDPVHKNVIKLNPTPMLLWSSNNITLSYERILKDKQSMTFTLGFLEFPSILDDTIAHLVTVTDRQKQGINFCFEYRFYFLHRNTKPIPDGLYLAPFFSFYGYQFSNKLDIINTQVEDIAEMKGSLYAFNLGCELGYQFVLWDRMTIDLVLIGPATSYYGGKVTISGDISKEEINGEIYEKIKEKYPMVEDIVFEKSFTKDGTLDLFSVGYRYLVQIGFHF